VCVCNGVTPASHWLLCVWLGEAGLAIPMRRERVGAGVPRRHSVVDEDDDDDDDDESTPAPLHRTFFPETWLWTLERMKLVC